MSPWERPALTYPPQPPPQQSPGSYPQAPGPYPQGPGPYAQTPGPYPQAPGPYAQAPAPYAQAPGPYPQAPGPHAPGSAWPPPQQPYDGGMPMGAMPMGGVPAGCQLCGASPAAPVSVRGHQGMLVIMRFLRRQGTFCRTCALAVFRDMQADTMIQGWWGPLSVLITPFTLLVNLGSLSGIKRIPEPVTAGWRPPLDPGRPVFRRPAGLLALVPLTGLALLVLAVPILMLIGLVAGPSGSDGTSSHPTLKVGSCALNNDDWPHQDLAPVSCDSALAQLRVTDPGTGSCPSGDYLAYPEYSSSGDKTLCLHPLK
ncbi:hypothetical protein AB0E10_05235 [Streptomyces sp. NPDC048045]|uniref:LppU/SCO3897 family protein n=1 Tax=Streptomyces sp. NPDC048045 TaxID=3154710 RepID=UPI0034153EEA